MIPVPKIQKLLPALVGLLTLLTLDGCGTAGSANYGTPNIADFNTLVWSGPMRASIAQSTLLVGMPQFAVRQILATMEAVPMSPVASVGSNQLIQPESDTKSMRNRMDFRYLYFRESYKTPQGVLNIWYSLPDFYLERVKSFDTLLFAKDSARIIAYASDRNKIMLKQPLTLTPTNDTLRRYAEVHHRNDPIHTITYWYALNVTADGSIKIGTNTDGYGRYQIEQMELNGEPVSEFHAK